MSQPKIYRTRTRVRWNERLSAQYSTEQIAAAMENARVDPALVYAFRKTGRFVLDSTLDLLTPEEEREFAAAIDEFKAQQLVGKAGA
jgi:hypothetical protein